MITLILGILQALGPAGRDKSAVEAPDNIGDIWKGIFSGGYKRTAAKVFLGEVDRRDEAGTDKACKDAEVLQQELREIALSLALRAGAYRSGEDEPGFIKRDAFVLQADFEPYQVGEIMLGQAHDLAVVEVLGINVERLSDGEVRKEEGTLLLGMMFHDGKWRLQNAYWYPQKQDIE